MKGDRYRLLSRGAKLAYALATLRDDPVRCGACRMQVDPRQLGEHAERCTGREWGGAPAGWISSSAVQGLGISRSLLCQWVAKGHVRRREIAEGWLYWQGDLIIAVEKLLRWHRARRAAKARRRAMRRWRLMHAPALARRQRRRKHQQRMGTRKRRA